MKRSTFLAAILFALWMPICFAQSVRPYTEGPVTEVSSIKIKEGGFDKYMAYLAGDYKALMEEYKQAGLIEGWAVYGVQARSPKDPDLYLTITYKNMAAFDGLEDRLEPAMNKVFGSRDKATQGGVDREAIRQVLGSELVREYKFK